ncbi:hypothetical protein SPD48_01045 [Pseudogracilibacillus sp. SE30717A]|uniref:hypothetical protein n=1 Tax=Pseudogracilibacillus sp. SE30717A TaxID=3098293 RepID=UPI00300E5421
MQHERDKYNLLSIGSLGLAILIGFIAMIKSTFLLIIVSFYMIAASLICEALLLNISFRQIEGLKQLARAIVLIIFVTYLLFTTMRKL